MRVGSSCESWVELGELGRVEKVNYVKIAQIIRKVGGTILRISTQNFEIY